MSGSLPPKLNRNVASAAVQKGVSKKSSTLVRRLSNGQESRHSGNSTPGSSSSNSSSGENLMSRVSSLKTNTALLPGLASHYVISTSSTNTASIIPRSNVGAIGDASKPQVGLSSSKYVSSGIPSQQTSDNSFKRGSLLQSPVSSTAGLNHTTVSGNSKAVINDFLIPSSPSTILPKLPSQNHHSQGFMKNITSFELNSSGTASILTSSSSCTGVSPKNSESQLNPPDKTQNYYPQQKLRRIPEVTDVYRFIMGIFDSTNLNSETVIVFMIYMERMMQNTGVTIYCSNWRRVVLGAIILASKVWDDQTIWNVDFCSYFPEVPVQDLNNLERWYLKAIEYNVSVSGSIYARYFLELRDMINNSKRFWTKGKMITRNQEKKLKTYSTNPSMTSSLSKTNGSSSLVFSGQPEMRKNRSDSNLLQLETTSEIPKIFQ